MVAYREAAVGVDALATSSFRQLYHKSAEESRENKRLEKKRLLSRRKKRAGERGNVNKE